MSVPSAQTSLLDRLRERGGRLRIDDLVVFLVLAAFTAFLLWHSWDKWLHPITDSGRDLYIPEHLLAGKKLYRDLFYEYPPVGPYLLAAICAIFGSSLVTYTWIGIVTAALITAVLYELVRMTSSRLGAIATALFFVALHITNKTAFGSNFIFPYSYALAFGLLFILCAALFAVRFVRSGYPGAFWMAAAFALLAAWSRLEFAAVVVALAVALFAIRWVDDPAVRRKTTAHFAGAIAVYAVPLVVAQAFFGSMTPVTDWIRGNILYPGLWNSPGARVFHRHTDGTDFVLQNALLALTGFVLVAAAVVLIAVTVRAWRGRRRITALTAGIGLAIVLLAASEPWFFQAWTFALPCAAVALLIAPIRRALGEAGDPHEVAVAAILLVFAAANVPRIALRMSPEWYGFAFFVPVYPILAYVFFRALPRLRVYPETAALVWAALAVVIVARALPPQLAKQRDYRFPVDTPRGRFFDYDEARAASISAFIRYARSHSIRSLVVVPEGGTINYFANIDTSIRYLSLLPGLADEREVVRELSISPPDRILITPATAEQLGYYGGFGASYDVEIGRWIAGHYALEQRWPWMLLLRNRLGPVTSRSSRAMAP